MARALISRAVTQVFRIKFSSGTGTAFLHRNKKGSAFLTAAHNLKSAQEGDNIFFDHSTDWMSAKIRDIKFHETLDACAFSLDNFVLEKDVEPHQPLGILLGEELLFLGFPHDLRNTYPGQGFATPLVRGAIFSGIIKHNDDDIAILDGFNNPGYSGAPIYAAGSNRECVLFGLISGYRYERPSHGRVYQQLPGQKEQVLPDIYTKPNSGMIQAINREALDHLVDSLDSYLDCRPTPA